MHLAIHNYAEILAFATGLILLPKLRYSIMKWLVAFLFVTILVELSSLYLTTNFIIKHSTKIYNFYIGTLIGFFLLFLFLTFKYEISRKVTLMALFIFFIFYVINLTSLQRLNNFNYFTYLLGALLLVVLTSIYFFELLADGREFLTDSFF